MNATDTRYTVAYQPHEDAECPWAVLEDGEWMEAYPTEKQANREAAKWQREYEQDQQIEAEEAE